MNYTNFGGHTNTVGSKYEHTARSTIFVFLKSSRSVVAIIGHSLIKIGQSCNAFCKNETSSALENSLVLATL